VAKQQAHDLSAWVPKSDVVRETGISERSLERRVQARKIRQGYRTLPGRRPLPVLHPEDVEQLRAEMVHRVTEEGEKNLPALPVRSNSNGVDALSALLSAMTQQLPKERPLFLTLREASEYSGLPQECLKRLIAEEKLPAMKSSGYRIRRRDLDAL
jgi:excisionase family DNA binding protein